MTKMKNRQKNSDPPGENLQKCSLCHFGGSKNVDFLSKKPQKPQKNALPCHFWDTLYAKYEFSQTSPIAQSVAYMVQFLILGTIEKVNDFHRPLPKIYKFSPQSSQGVPVTALHFLEARKGQSPFLPPSKMLIIIPQNPAPWRVRLTFLREKKR